MTDISEHFFSKNPPLILASASGTRLNLLHSVKIFPDSIIPANIDETENPKELPNILAARLSYQKALKIAEEVKIGVIIGADTVVALGRRILPKALTPSDVEYCLQLLSQRRHKVYTGICIIKKTEKGPLVLRKKLVTTIVKFKKLTIQEIKLYCELGEGADKAGGYSILGFGESFSSFISGSYSNIMGLPLLQTVNMLNSVGYKC
jgi:septum formation protein